MRATVNAMVLCALVLSAFATPTATATAVAFDSQFDSEFGFDTGFERPDFSGEVPTGNYGNNGGSSASAGDSDYQSNGSASASAGSSSFVRCAIDATRTSIFEGETTILEWETKNASEVRINGQIVSDSSGSFETSALFTDTTFELEAFDGNGSKCLAQVIVNCEPPEEPKYCELDIEKHVDAYTAVPGQELSYTVTVKNVGQADCTGGGVRIQDPVDPNITYVRHELTGDVSAGYGNKPVYSNSDRLLRFDAHTLTPGEEVTIEWTGTVDEPEQCGDFTVHNQAKVTAKELDNFSSWEYSQNVKTDIENECGEPKVPECTLTPTVQTVKDGETATLTWTTDNATDVTITDFGVVALDGSGETLPLTTNTTYTLTATGEGGTVTCEAIVKVERDDPIETATVIAHKVVCTDEAQLPNYGNGGPNITADTAADWVAQNDSCTLVSGWEFEWTDDQSSDPGDTLVGSAGTPWNSFGPTDSNGQTSVEINLDDLANERVWFREVLKDGYISFTHGLNAGTNTDDFSAEFYCHTDVINYDNRDLISDLQDGETYYCVAWNSPEPVTPPPSCDFFTASPGAITVGDTITLEWETSNAVQAFINNGVNEVELDGSTEVSPLADTTYVLTVIGAEEQSVDCEVQVTVSEDSVPVCEAFTATPDTLPVGGGEVTLEWEVTAAEEIEILPSVGTTSDLTGSTNVDVTESTTFTLTATDENGDQVSCTAPVAVADPEPPFTCADNVDFSASDTSINRGEDVTLTWETTNVESVDISVINETALSGSETVSPSSDTTYVLTATRGDRRIECPVSIDVNSGGGGGGGSASPRCELDISDTRIELGEEITLEWETTSVREVTIVDDEGEVIFTTDNYLNRDKGDYFDGSITLEPTRDTEYTLIAERGSRDRECSVAVEIAEDDIVVLETRDQEPLVAGISLTQVPYTGFEAGPFMTFMFYALLVAWSLFITYLLVIRKRVEVAPSALIGETAGEERDSVQAMKQAEEIRPDVFAPSFAARQASVSAAAPMNLPTGTAGTVNTEAPAVTEQPVANPHQADDALVTEIENRAHSQHALLSSDAVRYFISTTEGAVERNESLDAVIAEAKKHYPLEDGWIVVNEARMRSLCETCQLQPAASSQQPYTPATVPEGTGSLAEAIVTGNVVAAYELIGNRPMFALADASADLDAVYRNRQGASIAVSELLRAETEQLSDEQIKDMIAALTGALDGTYTDEASAVKMAIMKAVKVLA